MTYITAAEYEAITERPQAEATDARIKRASQLLDARIGNYPFDAKTGFKLDVDILPKHQREAVKDWVAHMISFLYENGGVAPAALGALKLGRFSVSQHGGAQPGHVLPDEITYMDAILVSSGIVKRGVGSK